MPEVSSKAALKPLTRFTDRVADYVRYRPDYPSALFDLLTQRAGLGPDAVVADVGSGTGIFTRQLLDRGARVYAVEPNDAMRGAAEVQLGSEPRFTSIAGNSEATHLPDRSVSLITTAQAFHWFEPAATRREFGRISRPEAQWAIVWNSDPVRPGFTRDYRQLKDQYGTDSAAVKQAAPATLQQFDEFFGAGRWERITFPHFQILDRDRLRGLTLSSSQVPPAGSPDSAPMLAALDLLFDRYQQNGQIRMEYETELFLGRAAGPL